MCPWVGVRASGGTWGQVCRYAILSQVVPNLISSALLRFEINVRGASVNGFVGAGGIGQAIAERIRVRHLDEVAFIILLMIATVALIDWITGRIR